MQTAHYWKVQIHILMPHIQISYLDQTKECYDLMLGVQVYELQCLREKEQETAELTRQMAALTCHAHQEAELEEERFSQARARTDPVYILQQQHLQQQQQLLMQQQHMEMQQQHMEMQQQDMEMQQHDVQQQLQQQQMEMQASHHYPSLVTHQQYCCTPQQL